MKHLPTYAPYMEARLADAKALEAVAQAKAYLHQTRQAAKRVPPHARHAWVGTLKAAEDRLAQAKRRAAEAERALIHAWEFHKASMADVKARRAKAKAIQAAKKAA
jgi:hypothetical protein